MLEAVQCPKCSTRYGLRRERVKAVHSRAQCHRCQGIFPIYDVVARLLELPSKEQPDDATATMGFKVEDLEQLHALPSALPDFPEEPVFLEEELEPAPSFPPLEPMAESLSAEDLLGSDSEILEKTLVTQLEPVPETRTSPDLPEPLPDERTAAGQEEEALPSEGRTTGSYRSAKDAISQLFGEAPISPTPRLRRDAANGALEVEATLQALEHTLGGSEPQTPAQAPSAAPLSSSEPEFAAPGSATQHMSLAEMQAAIAAVSIPAEAPALEPSAQELEASEVTQMMDASRMAKQPDPSATNPVGSFVADIAPASDDPNLLRLRIGEEIYPNLGMDQLIRWVEEGRVIETHFVARQFSENWIEAHKVPGLRPVFERLRRLRAGGPEALPDATAPVKKSLFGGLFGKKEN